MITLPAECRLFCPGKMPYSKAWQWQQTLVAERKNTPKLPDVLILLEHPPVYTLGQGASTDLLKFNPQNCNVEVHRIERGGEVTYHAPGQIVGYPILNLNRHRKDLHWYLRTLETVLIEVLTFYGLSGKRMRGLTGVWVEGCKVGAIGVKVSRWITMHGFSLNVCPDMTGFKSIVPCGIYDRPVGSIAQFLPEIQFLEVQQQVAMSFAEIFDLQLIPMSNDGLM